jgi:hypothetical protein
MKKLNCIVFFSLFILTQSFSQETTRAKQMEREILLTDDADLEILSKGRKLLLASINQDSIQKAVEIQKYLDDRFRSSRVMPFWPADRELIAFWTQQYSYILKTENIEPQPNDGFGQKIIPPRDLLDLELQRKAILEKSKLLARIMSANLSDEEKQFLQLELATWIVDRSNRQHMQDSLNTLSNMFIDEFPHSNYSLFVRKYIRNVYLVSEWSYGLDFSLGYGSFKGELANYFVDYAPLAFGFEGSYRQYVLYLRAAIGVGSSAKQTFEHFGTWNKNLKLNVTIPELSFGYMLAENENFRLAPFVGVSSVMIDPPETERNIPGNNVKLYSDASLIYGVNFDLRVGSMFSPLLNWNEQSQWIIKLRFSVVPASYSGTNASFTGSTFFLTIGVGGIGRSIHRDE